MDHKQTAEKIVLPIVCAFAASVTMAECGQPEAPGLLVQVAE